MSAQKNIYSTLSTLCQPLPWKFCTQGKAPQNTSHNSNEKKDFVFSTDEYKKRNVI
jgi:hypothetical protein